MPVYFKNISSDIVFGTNPIEKMGGSKLTYSMYGDNIPTISTEKSFIQPIFVDSRGFTTKEDCQQNFTIYADSVYSGLGVGYLLDGVTEYGVNNNYGWHSSSGFPHYIGFKYIKPLQIKQLEIWNADGNMSPSDYKVQYYNGTDFVDVISGTNTIRGQGEKWTIDLSNNKVWSQNWRLYFPNGDTGYAATYSNITEIKITAFEQDIEQVIPTGNFIQPRFTTSDSGFYSAQCTKDNFTIYTSSVYSRYGIGYLSDGDTVLKYKGDSIHNDILNIWHSNNSMPQYVGFRYNQPLKVKGFHLWNGDYNILPWDWTVQYYNSSTETYTDLISGTNEYYRVQGGDWYILMNDNNITSTDWRIVFTAVKPGSFGNYMQLLEADVIADVMD